MIRQAVSSLAGLPSVSAAVTGTCVPEFLFRRFAACLRQAPRKRLA